MLPGTKETEILKEQLEIAIDALQSISERAGPPENIAKYALEHIEGCAAPVSVRFSMRGEDPYGTWCAIASDLQKAITALRGMGLKDEYIRTELAAIVDRCFPGESK